MIPIYDDSLIADEFGKRYLSTYEADRRRTIKLQEVTDDYKHYSQTINIYKHGRAKAKRSRRISFR
eukprot:4678434-Amphidinium_carterae.1